MKRKAGSWVWALVAGALAGLSPAMAADTGRVVDESGGPIAQAMVVLSPRNLALGQSNVVVFTDSKGRYQFPAEATGDRIRVSKLGFEPHEADVTAAAATEVKLAKAGNLASQAPPSAWLPGAIDDHGRANTVLQCASCHQFPTDKVMNFATAVKGLGEADRKKSWQAMIAYMRVKFFEIGPDGSLYDPSKMDYQQITSAQSGLFDAQDEEMISAYLAKHLTGDFQTLPDYQYGAPLGVNDKTLMREYQLPQDSFVREIGLVNGSPYLWGADLQKNRLLRLDPKTGTEKSFPIPFDGPTGPHTIIDDAEGNLWVTMIENGVVGRFDPRAETWKLFVPFAANEMAHDIAPNNQFQVAFDPRGRIWMSLISSNRLGWLDPKTGETGTFSLPVDKDEPVAHRSVYGVAMTGDGKRVWFSQLSGGIGAIDTETGKMDVFIDFPQGAGPRRMAIDDNDVLYVPLFGTGELLVYDNKSDKEIARVRLPDINAAVYSAVWDPWRRVVWLGTSNADVIYKYLPESRTFEVFPLPSRMGYLRMITFDRNNGNLWTSYANIPTGVGPSRFVMIDPGDEVVPTKVARSGR